MFGTDMQAHNGDSCLQVPLPATYLVGSDGIIRHRFLDADHAKRLDPQTALQWIASDKQAAGG